MEIINDFKKSSDFSKGERSDAARRESKYEKRPRPKIYSSDSTSSSKSSSSRRRPERRPSPKRRDVSKTDLEFDKSGKPKKKMMEDSSNSSRRESKYEKRPRPKTYSSSSNSSSPTCSASKSSFKLRVPWSSTAEIGSALRSQPKSDPKCSTPKRHSPSERSDRTKEQGPSYSTSKNESDSAKLSERKRKFEECDKRKESLSFSVSEEKQNSPKRLSLDVEANIQEGTNHDRDIESGEIIHEFESEEQEGEAKEEEEGGGGVNSNASSLLSDDPPEVLERRWSRRHQHK